jgi:hypothetical protein
MENYVNYIIVENHFYHKISDDPEWHPALVFPTASLIYGCCWYCSIPYKTFLRSVGLFIKALNGCFVSIGLRHNNSGSSKKSSSKTHFHCFT